MTEMMVIPLSSVLETNPQISALGLFHLESGNEPAVVTRSGDALDAKCLAARVLKSGDVSLAEPVLDGGAVQLITCNAAGCSVMVSCPTGCHLFVAVVPKRDDVGQVLYRLKEIAGVPLEIVGIEPVPVTGSCPLEIH